MFLAARIINYFRELSSDGRRLVGITFCLLMTILILDVLAIIHSLKIIMLCTDNEIGRCVWMVSLFLIPGLSFATVIWGVATDKCST